jgi:hypothetical protein
VAPDDLIVGLALVALFAGTFALIRRRIEREPVVLLDIALRDGSIPDVAAWALFFRSLQALERRGWRGALFGQPWVALEFRSDDGALRARCAVAARQGRLVRTLLCAAISGIEISTAE